MVDPSSELTAIDVLNSETKAGTKGIVAREYFWSILFNQILVTGVSIVLEYVDQNTFSLEEIPGLATITSGLPANYCKLLTSSHSQITGISNLNIMSVNEAHKPDPMGKQCKNHLTCATVMTCLIRSAVDKVICMGNSARELDQ
jgi:hypothetical protein